MSDNKMLLKMGDIMTSTNKKALTASLAAVLACLIALIGGVSAFFSGQENAARLGDSEFAAMLDDYSAALDKLETGKTENSALAAQYDGDKASYDEQQAAYDKAVADYESDVMEYNQGILAYTVGKNALSSGVNGINEAKQRLETGWAAYEQGKAEFDSGKAAYEQKLSEYNEGKAAYDAAKEQLDQLDAAIEVMEKSGFTHQEALDTLASQLGLPITDEYISAARAELDRTGELLELAGAALPEAQAQIEAGEKQLGESYAMLTEGQAQLDAAEKQLAAGQAQVSSMSSDPDSAAERFKTAEADNAAAETALSERKTKLRDTEESLKKYTELEASVQRWRETLIDKGYGSAGSSDAELLDAARADAASAERAQTAEALLRTAALVLMLVSVACTVYSLWRSYKTGSDLPVVSVVAAAAAVLYLGCTVAHAIVSGSAEIFALVAAALLAASTIFKANVHSA